MLVYKETGGENRFALLFPALQNFNAKIMLLY